MERDLVERAFDEFKSLFARKIIEDEMLWRELEDRYGEYFEGGMGAEATLYLTTRGVQVVGAWRRHAGLWGDAGNPAVFQVQIMQAFTVAQAGVDDVHGQVPLG